MTVPPAAALHALDLRALADSGQTLAGALELAELPRWRADAPDWPGAAPLHLHWQARCEWRKAPGADAPGLGAALRRPGHSAARHPDTRTHTRRSVTVAGAAARQLWLHLAYTTQAPQTCQRCLVAFLVPVEVQRWFRLVASEAEAAAEDEHCSEDLLTGAARFDLLELIEDELLLALPLAPMHAVCPPTDCAASNPAR